MKIKGIEDGINDDTRNQLLRENEVSRGQIGAFGETACAQKVTHAMREQLNSFKGIRGGADCHRREDEA